MPPIPPLARSSALEATYNWATGCGGGGGPGASSGGGLLGGLGRLLGARPFPPVSLLPLLGGRAGGGEGEAARAGQPPQPDLPPTKMFW